VSLFDRMRKALKQRGLFTMDRTDFAELQRLWLNRDGNLENSPIEPPLALGISPPIECQQNKQDDEFRPSLENVARWGCARRPKGDPLRVPNSFERRERTMSDSEWQEQKLKNLENGRQKKTPVKGSQGNQTS